MRAIVLLVLLTSCAWDGEGVDCNDLTMLYLRDPRTGSCSVVGALGDDCKACGNCVPPNLDTMGLARCNGFCSHAPEASCLTEPSCHPAYSVGDNRFLGCWDVPPVSQPGACASFNADECSRRFDCSPWYAQTGAGMVFDHCSELPPKTSCAWALCGGQDLLGVSVQQHCVQECGSCTTGPSCPSACHATCVPDRSCDDVECPLGTACTEDCSIRDPSRPAQCLISCQPVPAGAPGGCDGAITCADAPPACPEHTVAGRAGGCYTGYCVPLSGCSGGDPGTCLAAGASSPSPACPSGTVAGTVASAYTGYCIPLAACGGSPLGTCEAASAAMSPPACPAGTIPGTINGEYTGACIAANQCQQLACDALFSEAACAARVDCRSVERGHACACGPSGCDCATRTFERCEAITR